MSIIDLIIMMILAFGFVIGFKRGVTKEIVCFAGFFVVIVLAFIFKNNISTYLYNNLPFFKWSFFKGLTVLNIVLYEVLAFIIIAAVLGLVLKLLIALTSLFENLLKATVILSVPSKILGGIVGVLEFYFIIFAVLYIVSLPFFNVTIFEQSTLKNKILNETPYISMYTEPVNSGINEIVALKDKYTTETSDEFNYQALDILLKYKVITLESTENLVNKNKINIENVDELINKYKEAQ